MIKELFVQSSIPEFEHDGDVNDWRDFAVRSLSMSLGSQNESLVVLQDNPQIINYLHQFNSIIQGLGLPHVDAALLPHTNYFLDVIVQEHLHLLKPHLSRKLIARPYAYTENLDAWMTQLQTEGYQISIPFSRRVYFENLNHPQHRGSWTGRLNDKPSDGSGGNGYFPRKYNIPYPTSYMGIGIDQIQEARHRVITESGIETVYAKLLFGAGGFGVAKINSNEELITYYHLLQETGALMLFGQEQPFEIQAEIQDVVAFASLQFVDRTITTPGILSVQFIDGHNWRGNEFNTTIAQSCTASAQEIFANVCHGLLAETGEIGGGGIDFAIVRENNDMSLVMVEPNFDREVGANSAISVAHALGVSNNPFLLRKFPEPNCDLITFWNKLQDEGLSFNVDTKCGIFPIVWVEGSAYVFATAHNEKDLENLIEKALNTLMLDNYIN